MAKGNSGIFKQDMVISQFSKDIRQLEKRNWTSISEKCTGANKQVPTVEKIRTSMYNPNNPLNGSKNWTKEQHLSYRESQKAIKQLTKETK